MRSRRSGVRLRFSIGAAIFVALLALVAGIQANAADDRRPSEAEIARALDAVKADPNLAALRTIKMLRWKDADAPAQPTGAEAVVERPVRLGVEPERSRVDLQGLVAITVILTVNGESALP